MKTIFLTLLLAIASCQEILDDALILHCAESFPVDPDMHDDYVFTICCMNSPGFDIQARNECIEWLYGKVGPIGGLHPSQAQLESQFGYTGWHTAIVNGAIYQLQRDDLGNYYQGPTNGLHGEIEYQMGAIPPVNSWKPLDILECYILRPVDKSTYAESQVTLKPGMATSSEDPIVLHVAYGGTKQTMPLAPGVASVFTFSAPIDLMAVTNTDHVDLTVLANVSAPFSSEPGDALNRHNYCTNNATLGKFPYPMPPPN